MEKANLYFRTTALLRVCKAHHICVVPWPGQHSFKQHFTSNLSYSTLGTGFGAHLVVVGIQGRVAGRGAGNLARRLMDFAGARDRIIGMVAA